MTSPAITTLPRLAYRVEEAAHILSISRSVMYELIRSGRLKSFTEGRTRLITMQAIQAYVAHMEATAE